MILLAHLLFLVGGLAWVVYLGKRPNVTVLGAFASAIVLDVIMELINAGVRPEGYPQPVAYAEPHLGFIPATNIPFTIPLYIALMVAPVSLFTTRLACRYGTSIEVRIFIHLFVPLLMGAPLAAAGEYAFDALGVWEWMLGNLQISGPVLGAITVTLIGLVSHLTGCLAAWVANRKFPKASGESV
jgi:hypothetical protein